MIAHVAAPGAPEVGGLLADRRDAQWVRYRRNPDLPAAWVSIVDAILAALPSLPPAQCLKKGA